uniref:Uncharacterized protein n=1 Tax=Cucumis melo TaxID=3656 RepID=A0A9I9EKI6_CUCME
MQLATIQLHLNFKFTTVHLLIKGNKNGPHIARQDPTWLLPSSLFLVPSSTSISISVSISP